MLRLPFKYRGHVFQGTSNQWTHLVLVKCAVDLHHFSPNRRLNTCIIPLVDRVCSQTSIYIVYITFVESNETKYVYSQIIHSHHLHNVVTHHNFHIQVRSKLRTRLFIAQTPMAVNHTHRRSLNSNLRSGHTKAILNHVN